MKRIIILTAFIFCVFIGNTQVIETNVPAGKWVLRTLSTTSWVETFTSVKKISSLVAPTVVDTVFSYDATINRPSGKLAAVTFTPGSTVSIFTIEDDSLTLNRAAGIGVNPVIELLYWDTIAYSNCSIKNITILDTIYTDPPTGDVDTFLTEASYVISTSAEITALTPLLVDGDIVGVQAGSVLDTTITAVEGVTYAAFGIGEKPILKGTRSITGWVQRSPNVWAAYTNIRFNQLYDDDVKQSIAKNVDVSINERNTVTSVVNDSTFISTDLIGTDWTNSYCMGSFAVWSFQSLRVIACNSETGQITLERPPTTYPIYAGNKVLMSNSISNVTEAGKWCLNESVDTVYYYATTEPTNIEVSTIENGFVVNNAGNVTIKNIKLVGFENGVNVNEGIAYKATGIVIDNCEFQDCYKAAVDLSLWTGNFYYPTTNSLVTNNIITGSSGNAIRGWIQQVEISNNAISEIGLLEDIGLDGYVTVTNGATAIFIKSDTCTVTDNIISNVGYNGIRFTKAQYGYQNNIENNNLKKTCLNLSDGAAIYTYGVVTGSTITGNIIDSIGGVGMVECHGIYCDASTDGITITDNVVSNCLNPISFGQFMSNTTNATVSGNTYYNNTMQLRFKHWSIATTLANNVISNNTFYSLTNNQINAQFTLKHEFTSDTLELTGNKYYATQNMNSIYWDDKAYSLSGFQTFSGQEVAATAFDTLINSYTNIQLLSPNLVTNGTFDSAINGYGTAVGSWDDTQLDSGCLKITIADTQGFFTKTLDSLGNNILKLEFDVIAPSLDLISTTTIGGELINPLVYDNERRHYTLYKDVSEITIASIASYITGNATNAVYFDNLEAYNISADYIEPTEKSKLFVNETSVAAKPNFGGYNFNLPSGSAIDTTATIPAYTAIIGIRQ